MPYQNVLLIDDDSDDQEIFTEAITRVSDTVTYTTLSSAKEALAKLNSNQLPDVIFLDLNMPVMGGEEFLTVIKANNLLQNIPVIIFSTSANPATIATTKKLGAIDFIVKPGRFDELVTILTPYFKS